MTVNPIFRMGMVSIIDHTLLYMVFYDISPIVTFQI